MADLITTKAAFPKSGGLAVANGAVSVNAGNGLHVNPTTGMVEVPVDTTAGLGYGSNGLEVEVDGSTIDFNSSGQLTALGGGGGLQPSNYFCINIASTGVLIKVTDTWYVSTQQRGLMCGVATENAILITHFYSSTSSAAFPISIKNATQTAITSLLDNYAGIIIGSSAIASFFLPPTISSNGVNIKPSASSGSYHCVFGNILGAVQGE